MRSNARRILILLHILLMCSLSFGEQSGSISKPEAKVSNPEKIRTVSYCDLVKNQNLLGELVRVKARWAYGFEWSVLYSRECMALSAAVIEFDKEENLCGGTFKRSEKIAGTGDGFAEVVMIGRLHGGPGRKFGHMGAYSYQFVVTCLERGKQLNAFHGHRAL